MKIIKETLQSLLERYKVHAGEYKKPDDLVQEIAIAGDYEATNSIHVDDYLQLEEIFSLFEQNYQKQEFLIHKYCFHPSFDLYYACPDTTSAEFVYVIEECLNSL
jgi:hypothetical protein